MSEKPAGAIPEPKVVEYDPVTGVPAEFNEFLPKDCPEYQKWKHLQDGGADAKLEDLTIKDKDGDTVEKQLPGGKVKKKAKQEILLDRSIRNKKKCVTTVYGLHTFGIKLADAAKVFGKKFACGASVTKCPSAPDREQIDVQGDVLDQLVDLILEKYGKSNGVEKSHIYHMDNKKKEAYFDDDDDE